jgi:hypothetical protein
MKKHIPRYPNMHEGSSQEAQHENKMDEVERLMEPPPEAAEGEQEYESEEG